MALTPPILLSYQQILITNKSMNIKEYRVKTLEKVKYVPLHFKNELYVKLERMKDMNGETLEPIERSVSEMLFNFELLIKNSENDIHRQSLA